MKSKSKQKNAGNATSGETPVGNQEQQAASEQFTPDKKPRLLRWLIIVMIILALILAGLFGWLWWRDRNSDNAGESPESSATEESEAPEEDAAIAFCTEDLTHYQNAELGLQFCYPEAWGTVAVADARFAPSDTGTRQNLSFSDKSEVNLGVASADWETDLGRDGVCSDPASPTLPPFSPFSTSWNTFDDGSSVSSVDRGIERMDGQYLIQEFASNTLAETVCLTGYAVLDGTPFTHATGSYATTFTAAVPEPADHMASPNVLIPVGERNAFYALVKTVENL